METEFKHYPITEDFLDVMYNLWFEDNGEDEVDRDQSESFS